MGSPQKYDGQVLAMTSLTSTQPLPSATGQVRPPGGIPDTSGTIARNLAAATPALDRRSEVERLFRAAKVTGDLGDFFVATVLEAFLRLKVDEAALRQCVDTILQHPGPFAFGCQVGWHTGVLMAIDGYIEDYKQIFGGLMEFLNEFKEVYNDYWSAITDLDTLIEIVQAVKDSRDQSLDMTIQQIYDAVATNHSELAAVMLDLLDRLNRLTALRRIFTDDANDEAIKGLISDLGQTLSTYWQNDINRFFDQQRNPFGLGHALGQDYGKLSTEIALVVIGL